MTQLLAQLPRRSGSPQSLGNSLGITVTCASRLLKALAQTDPMATFQIIPDPNPLREIISSAIWCGADSESAEQASRAIDEFDQLIRNEAGDRGALSAMLSAWLP